MKKVIFTLLLSLPGVLLFSQRTPRRGVDSVLILLNSEDREDTVQVQRFLSLAGDYTIINPDSSIYYADKALRLSEKLNYKRGIVLGYERFSSGFKVQGDFALSMEYLQKAKQIYNDAKDKRNLRRLEFTEANLNSMQGEHRSTLDVYLSSLPQQELTRGYSLGSSYSFIARSYVGLNKPDSAIYYAKLAMPVYLEIGRTTSQQLVILGDAYIQLNQFDSALSSYQLSLEKNRLNDVNTEVLDADIGIAGVYQILNNTDSSIWYGKRALDGARSGSFRDYSLRATRILAAAFEKVDPGESIRYYKMAAALNDSIYGKQKISKIQNLKYAEALRKREAEERDKQSKAEFRLYMLIGGLLTLALITVILIRSNRHKQIAKEKIERAYNKLKVTQRQLIQSEKMASLGELTAGIAHEIQNPLNFVNNFSEVNKELISEMKEEIEKGNYSEVKQIARNIEDNQEKITHHGKRADAIVKGMLQHSRTGSGQKEPTDINALADEYLRLAYHGLRAKDKSINAVIRKNLDESIGNIRIIPQDIGRVLLNLINNAFYAVSEKQKQNPDGYEPAVSVMSKKLNGKVELRVMDNGTGIPGKVLDKIFQPFFTTKPAGEGTGLGLSLSYDIITKGHGGELKVETKEGEGSTFVIILPTNKE